jgi:hypothetical protein
MSCPLLRRAHPPRCRAVAGEAAPVGPEVLASYCRGAHDNCPGYRYVRAAGRLLNPADFQAWVVQRIAPGRVDPCSEPHLLGSDAT